MKLLTAVIRPEKYAAVQKALEQLGITQLTWSEVWGEGQERGETFIYRSMTFQDTRVERLKLELAVDDDTAEQAVEAILASSWTGRIGDGVVMVLPVEGVNRIPSRLTQGAN
jgi:nitrogen regulatory protein PII